MAKGSGDVFSNPFNAVDNTDPNKPDSMGDDLYFNGWAEINKMHLAQTGEMVSTPNAEASHEMYGGPAPGEPNPGKMGGKG